jgi:hypothetical protein
VAGRGYGEGYGDGYEALKGGRAVVTFENTWVCVRVSRVICRRTVWSVGVYMWLLRNLSHGCLDNGFDLARIYLNCVK